MNKLLKVGDRVLSSNGHYGRVTNTEFKGPVKTEQFVNVKWDKSGISYRPAEGLKVVS